MNFKPTLCIYHGNCADGFTAAYAVWKRFKDAVKYHPGKHGEAPPDVTGEDVVIVDFSYKKPIIIEMMKTAKSITILDHHVSAQEDLIDLPTDLCPIHIVFDMDRSGAMITWQYYHPEKEIPMFVKHIQDRDLWKFEYPESKDIQMAIFSYPYEFKVWDKLANGSMQKLKKEGETIQRRHQKDMMELLKLMRRRMVIAGYDVPVANLPYIYSSDAGNLMSQGEPFAACYYDGKDKRYFSLRSSTDGVDVSKIAVLFGGGGHKHAAGFEVELTWSGDKE